MPRGENSRDFRGGTETPTGEMYELERKTKILGNVQIRGKHGLKAGNLNLLLKSFVQYNS